MSELKDKGVSTKTNNQLSGISEDVARQLEREDDSEVIFLQTYADLSRRLTGTSPGTLQDVTMDTSYGVGYRSPCVGSQFYHGSTVSQGRSVREFEEQMSALRKENFNLKLRLYFLEENLPGYQQANKNQTEDTLMKQLVDHKVELEMLRKDLLDKQELLKDAADALAHMDNLAKNKSEDRDAEPQQTCSNSDEDSQEKKSTEEVLNKENLSVLQKICELEEMLANANEQINEFQNQITTLDDILIQRDDTIKEYEEKIKQLIFQNSELQETLETRDNEIHNAEVQQLEEELKKLKGELADKMCMLQEADEKINNQEQTHNQACRTIQKLMLNIKSQQDEIKKLKKQMLSPATSNSATSHKANSNAGFSGLDNAELNCSLSDSEVLNDASIARNLKLEAIIELQEKTIQTLKAEVKKKTNDLQQLVNKELWEKNREIERLTKLLNCNSPDLGTTSGQESMTELQQSFSDVEYVKALDRNKFLQRKVDVLIQRLGNEHNYESAISKLRSELRQTREEADNAEKWRRDCADLCTVLSNRLEELAGFLNSLLKHKDILGFLAADRRHAIRKAVNRSLDLSKSLNVTLSMTGTSMIDQSFTQLSNLSGILGQFVDDENNTFNSHEAHGDMNNAIESLKAENKALKKELDKRRCMESKKERRSLPIPLPGTHENQSESEAWSEPDRKVSLARMGLEDHSLSLTNDLPQKKHSKTSDTDTESDTCTQNRNSKSSTQERVTQLENIITQRDERILEIQCQLVEADNRLKKENLRVIDMTEELEHLRKRNEELHTDLISIGCNESSSSHNESLLIRQIEEKTRELQRLTEERNGFSVQCALSEQQVIELKAELSKLKKNHQDALKLALEQEEKNIDKLKNDMQALMNQRLNEQELKYEAALERDFIERTVYEANKKQLSELQRQFVEAQRTIDYLNENEQELKQTLVQSELTVRALNKELDECTLQASKTIKERTKALNDKLHFEKLVQELKQQIAADKIEYNLLQQQNQRMANEYEKLKTRFNIISVKQQNGSDASNSGYTSEEVPQRQAANINNGTQRDVAAVAQRVNNPSPDLGIESDPGRVSSVELSNAQHPQLKTVELPINYNSKNIISDEENIKPIKHEQQSAEQTGAHDCAKVDQENADLRRKLLRTRRALEDTYQKLHIANQKKAQVEKDIKNQILKTHNVLKNVRSNMENEL